MVSAGRLWPELFPRLRIWGNGGIAGSRNHTVVVCGALSSAGRFWLARLSSLKLGGGELRAGVGGGNLAAGRRVWLELLPKEQPAVAGLGWAAHGGARAGRRVGLSRDDREFCV